MAKQPFSLDLIPEDKLKADIKRTSRDPFGVRSKAKAKRGETIGDVLDRTQPDATISQGFTGGTGALFNALDRRGVNTAALRDIDENLIGIGRAERAAWRLGRDYRAGDPMSGWDMFDVAAALPVSRFAIDPALRLGFRGAKALGQAGARFVPAAVRDLAVRGGETAADWAKQNGSLFSRGEQGRLADIMADPGYIDVPFSVVPGEAAAAPSMAIGQRRIANQRPVVRGLPAPEPTLGLPAPGPGLPPFASKPRGGQWWIDRPFDNQFNNSPEAAARDAAWPMALTRWVPEEPPVAPGNAEDRLRQAVAGQMVPQTTETDAQKWLERALTKYYKNEFGAPDDPLRSLAERGLHYDPDMTPEKWQATVNSHLLEDPIQHILFPPNREGGMPGAGSDLRGETLAAMPWLAKAPVTDKVYGITGGGLDLSHFTDEFLNALGDAEAAGLPADLAVRPESLGRMTFAQAVEHVGKINQFRAKEMERAALDAQNNPVTHVFKEYSEDNPMGLRWVEMAPPKGDAPTNYDVEEELRKALKYEGDTMGHCVGGYCPDVMSGRSRIFSLRDAKGEPHVTIEAAPRDRNGAALEHIRSLGVYPEWVKYSNANRDMSIDAHDLSAQFLNELGLPPVDYSGQDIIQIKGKQNRAPKDAYLPFVQDFVKSGQWGNVGDMQNTGLVKLPDGRYITQQQYDDVVNGEGLHDLYQSYDYNAHRFPSDPSGMSQEDWDQFSRHFEGYAIGGRVDADRCFCHNPLSVKRAA